MIACHCHQVSDRTIDHTISAGARSVDEVTAACRAGGDCGGCHETISRLLARSAATSAAVSGTGRVA